MLRIAVALVNATRTAGKRAAFYESDHALPREYHEKSAHELYLIKVIDCVGQA